MSERQYRLINLSTGWADPNLFSSEEHAVAIADGRSGVNDWAVQTRENTSRPWVLLPQYVIKDPAATPASSTVAVVGALYDVARALKAADRTREEADESLRLTTHVDYHGYVASVVDEVYPTPPVLDLQTYYDKGMLLSSSDTVSAVRVIAADFRARAASARPQDGDDFVTDYGADVADALADAYDECARDLLKAFGLTEEV